MRKAVSEIMLLLLPIGIFAFTLNIQQTKGEGSVTIIVPDDYTTLQTAINNANECDTIYVKAGTYSGDITIDKAGLKIFGENRKSVVQGRITIEADNILFNGFTIRGSSNEGIFLKNVDSCTISNNNVSNIDIGISIYREPGMLEQTYGGNNICGNILTDNNVGILSNSHMGIPPNTIYGNNFFGNILVNNSYGILISCDIGIPNPNKIYGGNTIRGNTLSDNSHGFYFNYSLGILSLSDGDNIVFGENIVQGNNITNNDYAVEVYCEKIGILNTYGHISLIFGYNRIFNNYLIDNSNLRSASIKYIGIWNLDTLDGKSIVTALEHWDDGYPSGGNFWSNYTGIDEKKGPNQDQPGSDGIGDTPYVIDALNSDKYPLMTPQVHLDSTPPATIDTYKGLWESTDFTIYLLATDELSGVKETYYRINDGPIQNLSGHGHPLITIEGANNTLEYWSTDNADNEELPHRVLSRIKLDKTPPVGSILINNNASYANSTSVMLTITATDNLSGVNQVRYSNDGVWDIEAWETLSQTHSWTLTTNDGTKIVYVQFKDNAGCVSQPYFDIIVLDATSPSILITSPSPGYEIKSSSVLITWTGSDALSGINHYEIKLDAGSWVNVETDTTKTYTGLNDGSHTIDIKAFDQAGNTKEETISFIINTSPLFGPGYLEETVITATIIIIAIGIVAYLLKIRKHKSKS